MTRYMVSFWKPGSDYTPPTMTAKTMEAAVNKAWSKVPKKHKEGMLFGFATDLDIDDMEAPTQFKFLRGRWRKNEAELGRRCRC